MKRICAIILTLLLMVLTAAAQDKAEQLKHIREVYAQAHQKAAGNGKGGKAPMDVFISQIDMGMADAEYSVEEDTETRYFFERASVDREEDFPGKAVCYLITRNWMADGHTNYREMLFDPEKGHLLFSFMKAETHAGFKVETRYYYDEQGRCIEQKHKVQDEETTADSHSWSSWDGDLEMGRNELALFNQIVNTRPPYEEVGSAPNPATTPKAQRLKEIRAAYAQAKEKMAKNDKGDGVKNEIEIMVNDQLSEDIPPSTTRLKCYYEHVNKDELFQHCYFITEKRESMYEESYEEYLTDPDPKSESLIFNYCKGTSEGIDVEMRYYYDDNGYCVESKVSDMVEAEPVQVRNKAGYLFDIFDRIMK